MENDVDLYIVFLFSPMQLLQWCTTCPHAAATGQPEQRIIRSCRYCHMQLIEKCIFAYLPIASINHHETSLTNWHTPKGYSREVIHQTVCAIQSSVHLCVREILVRSYAQGPIKNAFMQINPRLAYPSIPVVQLRCPVPSQGCSCRLSASRHLGLVL